MSDGPLGEWVDLDEATLAGVDEVAKREGYSRPEVLGFFVRWALEAYGRELARKLAEEAKVSH